MPNLNLDIEYFDHVKTVRLVGLLGKGSEVLPLKLWCRAAKHHAGTGRLTDYSAQEIESLVGWWGNTGHMVEAMVKVGFLEQVNGSYEIHGWKEKQGHIVAYKERAKNAAEPRWGLRRENATSNALGNPTSNAQYIAVQTSKPKVVVRKPPPHQHPPPKKFQKPNPQEIQDYAKEIGFFVDGQHFWDYYESRGWLIGKVPMKNWQAAVRTWKRNGYVSGRAREVPKMRDLRYERA